MGTLTETTKLEIIITYVKRKEHLKQNRAPETGFPILLFSKMS